MQIGAIRGKSFLFMKFTRIGISNYRNIEFTRLEVDAPRIFFVGRNGQGKTNFLEAVGYCTALRAFRARENEVVIGPKAGFAEVVYEGVLNAGEDIQARARIKRKGKEVWIDGDPVRRASAFVGRLPTVVLSSEDLNIARGSPSLRRRYIDTFLCGVDRVYYANLQRYQKAIQERNALLKSNPEKHLLDVFEDELCKPAVEVIQARKQAMANLNQLAQQFYGKLSGESEAIEILYSPNCDIEDENDYREMIKRSRKRDLIMQSTGKGPHRDDIQFLINGRLASDYASDGQLRSVVLALAFGIIESWRQKIGENPVVLADDILGELDPERRERFWQAMDPDLQLFATGTQLPSASKDWLVYEVDAGCFEKRNA